MLLRLALALLLAAHSAFAGGLRFPPGPQTTMCASAASGYPTIGGPLTCGAPSTISFQPGLLTAVTGTKSGFFKFAAGATVDNIEGSALLYTCVGSPTVTLYECGTSATCAGATAIGSVTLTAAGQAFDGTVSNPAITAGDYIAWAISGGTCVSVDLVATAQVH
jgi:hypothetical protein